MKNGVRGGRTGEGESWEVEKREREEGNEAEKGGREQDGQERGRGREWRRGGKTVVRERW